MVASFGEGRGRVRVETALDALRLDIEQALPCGLIVNESLTNALKYAFPGERRGSISIELRRDAAGRCMLRVADNGSGVEQRAGDGGGLGLRIMSYRAHAIGGEVTIANREEGGALMTCTCMRSELAD